MLKLLSPVQIDSSTGFNLLYSLEQITSKKTVPSISVSHFKDALKYLHTPQPEACDQYTGSFPGIAGGWQLVLELAGLFLTAPCHQGVCLQSGQCPCCCKMVLATRENSTLFILKVASLFDFLKHSIKYSRPIFLNFDFLFF